jgi:hypothetical protein
MAQRRYLIHRGTNPEAREGKKKDRNAWKHGGRLAEGNNPAACLIAMAFMIK